MNASTGALNLQALQFGRPVPGTEECAGRGRSCRRASTLQFGRPVPGDGRAPALGFARSTYLSQLQFGRPVPGTEESKITRLAGPYSPLQFGRPVPGTEEAALIDE